MALCSKVIEMMDDKAQPPADAEPDLEHGPCMLALSPKRRAFVMAMARNPMGRHTDWAKEAGYAKRGLRVRAFETYHDPKVQDAVMEVARATLGARGPLLAVHGLLEIAGNPKHQGRLKALELIANRVGFSEKRQIEIVHRDLTGDALIERMKYLSEKLGEPLTNEIKLPPHPLANLIEHQPAADDDGEGNE